VVHDLHIVQDISGYFLIKPRRHLLPELFIKMTAVNTAGVTPGGGFNPDMPGISMNGFFKVPLRHKFL